MSRIASDLQPNIKVDLQPNGESTTATLSYLSESGCRLTATTKLSENIKTASLRNGSFWLSLVKAQLRVNAVFAAKTGSEVTIHGLPFTDKGEPSKLATLTLSDSVSKSYPDAKLRKVALMNLMKVSL